MALRDVRLLWRALVLGWLALVLGLIGLAEGDGERFRLVVDEYKKAPVVTRDRMYIDTLQQVYSNVSKVLVDSRAGSNLLYLPLDKLMQQAGGGAAVAAPAPMPAEAPAAAAVDSRSRDGGRSREREVR